MFIGCNVGKRKKVHYDNCIYCQRSEQKNRVEYETLDAALEDDVKPCKHCLTMDKQIKAEFEKMNAFAKNFNLKFTNQNGLIYTNDNIDNLLFTRHVSRKERMAGNRTKGPKKRTHQNDLDFINSFIMCIQQVTK